MKFYITLLSNIHKKEIKAIFNFWCCIDEEYYELSFIKSKLHDVMKDFIDS